MFFVHFVQLVLMVRCLCQWLNFKHFVPIRERLTQMGELLAFHRQEDEEIPADAKADAEAWVRELVGLWKAFFDLSQQEASTPIGFERQLLFFCNLAFFFIFWA